MEQSTFTESKEYEIIYDEKLDALGLILKNLSVSPWHVYGCSRGLDRIRARLGDVPNLGSGITISAMESLVDQFNAGTIPVLLGHPASMGHGLNLQGSVMYIIMDMHAWDLDFYDQTIARVYRQGQKSDTVFVYHIVARGTKDEDILITLDAKDSDQQKLLKALG